jgi:hypothetical protein
MAQCSPIYKPLDRPQMTRVLDIMPGTGSHQIACSIRTINLSHCPNYEALSYCWGDPEPSSAVLIEGQPVYIPKNLHNALRNLRLHTRIRVIWADGLSIDQSNNIEKAQQILLMRQIYRQARKVLVFLGEFEDATETSAMLRLIRKLANGYKLSDTRWKPTERWGIQYYPVDSELTVYPELNTTDLGLSAADSDDWSMLRTFLSKPWFERVWVIQELSLSQFAEVIVGGSTLVWQDLADACYVLDESGLSSLVLGAKHRNVNCMDVFRWSLAHGEELDPLNLAEHARSFETTDARDRIYGLLGIIETDHPKYVVDYNLSIADVYAGFTLYCIDRNSNLDIFGTLHTPDIGQGSPNGLTDMPSWVTDWDKPRMGRKLITDPNYNASPGRAPSLVRISSNLLKVRGLLIDSIIAVGSPFLNEARYSKRFPGTQYGLKSEEASSVIKSWFAAVESVPYCYATGEWKGHAFATTLLAGFGEKPWDLSSKPPQKDLVCYSGSRVEVFKHLWWWLESMLGSGSDIDRRRIFPIGKTIMPDQWHLSSGIDNPKPGAVARLAKEMNSILASASGYTSLFATKNNWIGTGPVNIQVGDLVYLFYGARTPFIIRKGNSKGIYRLVGETYIHGLMFGEALQKGFLEEELILN